MLPEWLLWSLTLILIFLGIVGTLLPFLPGMFLIVVAAFIHLFPQISPYHLGAWPFGILLGLFFLGVAVDYIFGFLGAKIGGVSRVGLLMGVLGMILGIFTGPWGIVLGPLAGVFIGELIVANKSPKGAFKATAGYAVGNVTGMIIKILLALLMSGILIVSLLRTPSS